MTRVSKRTTVDNVRYQGGGDLYVEVMRSGGFAPPTFYVQVHIGRQTTTTDITPAELTELRDALTDLLGDLPEPAGNRNVER
jgi:hypothetical protein